MPSVAVVVVSASDIKRSDVAPNTPYVEIEYAGAKKTTASKEGGNPEWREKFIFDVVDGEDEMAFSVFLPGGVFVGKAVYSFATFGTDVDLCFELADYNNEIAGRLVVTVDSYPPAAGAVDHAAPPEPSALPAPTKPTPPAPAAQAPPPDTVAAQSAPATVAAPEPSPSKIRLSVSKPQMVSVTDFTCRIAVGGVQRVCDTTGNEEYLFTLGPEDHVTIDVLAGGGTYGSAKLKGSMVLNRSGTNCWIVVSNAAGSHVGKLLLTISSVVPPETVVGPLDSEGCEMTELVVYVLSAQDLPHECEACVYLSINDNDRATTTQPKSRAPVWNERFPFFVEEEEDTLSAKVFDNEDFVAEAIVPVHELLYVASLGRQLEVKLLDRKRKRAGLLVLGAETVPPLPPPAQYDAAAPPSWASPPATPCPYPYPYVPPPPFPAPAPAAPAYMAMPPAFQYAPSPPVAPQVYPPMPCPAPTTTAVNVTYGPPVVKSVKRVPLGAHPTEYATNREATALASAAMSSAHSASSAVYGNRWPAPEAGYSAAGCPPSSYPQHAPPSHMYAAATPLYPTGVSASGSVGRHYEGRALSVEAPRSLPSGSHGREAPKVTRIRLQDQTLSGSGSTFC